MLLSGNFKTLKFISMVINPNINEDEIRCEIRENSVDWNSVVKVGSSHLILPSLYFCFLKKNIKNAVPEELLNYLKEISKINKRRNLQILKQVDSISKIFDQINIKYAFLKGTAILISEPFNSIDERMVGDIDILVHKKHINLAKESLINEGYFEDNSGLIKFSKNIIKTRHLPRLNNKDYIASVELHKTIIDKKFEANLSSNKVLKRRIKFKSKYWIPNQKDILMHAILNWYFNDYGNYIKYLNFRSVIDVINLNPLKLKNNNNKPVDVYFSLLSVYFNEFPIKNYFSRTLFKLQLNYKVFLSLRLIITRIVRSVYLLSNRLVLFMKSKSYRKIIFENRNLLYHKLIGMIKKKS